MTADILDLPGWTVLNKRLDAQEYELEAEYTVQPTACQKCGVVEIPMAARMSAIRVGWNSSASLPA